MKAIFNHSVFSEENLIHLNWFMQIVEMSAHPFELISNLYEENMLPDGLEGTDCKIKITSERVSFWENRNDDEAELIAYATIHEIDF